MNSEHVTVFGGSGFVGRRIVGRLAADGANVRVAVRHPERAAFLAKEHGGDQVTLVYADVGNEESVPAAVEGAETVVNAVGHYVERGPYTFEAIHGNGALRVAQASAKAGVRRLVHISGVGADPASASPYVRARGLGEVLVVDAFPGTTILRPSAIFGPGDALFTRLAAMVRSLPVVPMFGRGETKLQPVYVGDVAEAVSKALATPETAGKVYELGGPRAYAYRSLLEIASAHVGRKRVLVPVPYFAWEVLAALMAPLPSAPLSSDQVKLMQKDNVVDPRALSFADLGIVPTPVDAILPQYVGKDARDPTA